MHRLLFAKPLRDRWPHAISVEFPREFDRRLDVLGLVLADRRHVVPLRIHWPRNNSRLDRTLQVQAQSPATSRSGRGSPNATTGGAVIVSLSGNGPCPVDLACCATLFSPPKLAATGLGPRIPAIVGKHQNLVRQANWQKASRSA